jgi:hypothetical protein
MFWEYILVFVVIAFAILIVSRRLTRQASGHDDCHCGTGACLDEHGNKVECLGEHQDHNAAEAQDPDSETAPN